MDTGVPCMRQMQEAQNPGQFTHSFGGVGIWLMHGQCDEAKPCYNCKRSNRACSLSMHGTGPADNDSLLDMINDLVYPEIGESAADKTRPGDGNRSRNPAQDSANQTPTTDFSVIPILNEMAEKRWAGEACYATSSKMVGSLNLFDRPRINTIGFSSCLQCLVSGQMWVTRHRRQTTAPTAFAS